MNTQETFYAEVIESTRFKGTRLVDFRAFQTEKERDDFITEYNTKFLLPACDNGTPEVYTIAQTGGYYNILDYKRSLLQDETFSK